MGMFLYFVRYVIEPEMQGNCVESGYREANWQCSSVNVTGVCLMSLFCASLIAIPIWLQIVKTNGRVQAWVWCSSASVATNLLFLTCGRGMENEYIWIIFLSCLNGFSFGGRYLSESILADAIDYDEFLTGTRCEGVYAMFKGFLLKITAIPAAALPIALLYAFGHQSPIDGVVQQQDPSIKSYCLIMCGIVAPSFFAFGAFIKIKFPLVETSQFTSLSRGISRHMRQESALDPITLIRYKPFEMNPEVVYLKFLLDAFPAYETMLELEVDIDGHADDWLITKCRRECIMAIGTTLLLFGVTTISYMEFMVKDSECIFLLRLFVSYFGIFKSLPSSSF